MSNPANPQHGDTFTIPLTLRITITHRDPGHIGWSETIQEPDGETIRNVYCFGTHASFQERLQALGIIPQEEPDGNHTRQDATR